MLQCVAVCCSVLQCVCIVRSLDLYCVAPCKFVFAGLSCAGSRSLFTTEARNTYTNSIFELPSLGLGFRVLGVGVSPRVSMLQETKRLEEAVTAFNGRVTTISCAI